MIDGTMTNVHEWLMDHTWITWYIRDGKGNLKLVWNNSNKAPPEITRWTGYQREQTDDTAVSDSYGRSLEKKWPEKKRTSFVKTLKDYPFGVSIALPITTQQYSLLPDLPYLQFRTWSALLRLNLTGSSTSQSVAVGKDWIGLVSPTTKATGAERLSWTKAGARRLVLGSSTNSLLFRKRRSFPRKNMTTGCITYRAKENRANGTFTMSFLSKSTMKSHIVLGLGRYTKRLSGILVSGTQNGRNSSSADPSKLLERHELMMLMVKSQAQLIITIFSLHSIVQ